MNRIARAEQLVAESLNRLRALAAESLEASDFSAVKRIAEIASVIESACPQHHQAPPLPNDPAKRKAVKPSRGNVQKHRAIAAKQVRTGEPMFSRHQEDLVKVSKSKRSTDPYEHRAPWRIVELLATRIATRAKSPE